MFSFVIEVLEIIVDDGSNPEQRYEATNLLESMQSFNFVFSLHLMRVIFVTPQNPGSLTTRQPAEYSWMSGNPTSLMKIGQSLLCKGSSTQGTKPVPTIYNDHTGSTCE